MSAVTGELLAEHVERFVLPGPDALVFANTFGSPLISSSFWQHHFWKGLQAAGVSCRFHDLRHTSVALLIAERAHPEAIQTGMGHSTINVAYDRYGHLFPELDEAIATSFGDRLRDARGRRGAGVGSGGTRPAPSCNTRRRRYRPDGAARRPT